jgi:hypothetical protein
MAKKANTDDAGGSVNKSAAIREYLATNPGAMPKVIVAALAEKGITVSPQMASLIKAKSKVKSARKQARASRQSGAAPSPAGQQSKSLDAALLLYKAAVGTQVPPQKIREAFLSLVETLG